MSVEVCYFSGTGNSLTVAKKIAAATDGTMISIASVVGQESIRPRAELAAEFSIRLPMNNLKYFFFQTHDHEKMFRRSEVKAADISRRVMSGRREKCRLPKTLFNYFMTPMYLLLRNFYVMDLRQKAKELIDSGKSYDELIPLTDRSIFADGNCNGCSMCAKVCPVHNIVLEKCCPVFQNRCEMCMACVEFCPQKAIHHWNIEPGVKYRHPEVTLSDMLEQSGAREG